MRNKVTIAGAGQTGGTMARGLAAKGYADIVLVDVIEGFPQGKALDITQAGPLLGFDSKVVGTNDWKETAGSDIVIITSGKPRGPGMSRDDLVTANTEIVKSVTEQAVKHSPNCIIIVFANPLDAMCYVALKVSGFPRERVFGQSGMLDTARFRAFLAMELKVSVEDVQAYVLGGHGDDMVPLIRYTTVAGIPISELLPPERVEAIVQRTRKGGGEIVSLLKTGSAYYAPAAGTIEMVESVLLDRKRILPCATYLEGEYGVKGIYMGVPVKLGSKGVEQIIEIKLTSEERAMFDKSESSVREVTKVTGL
ncbi:MAG: malate dehydrogenase [Anaerolineales bacterium]|nr:MAG: malate dehydrogenase [Anaerolineales bacterium]